MAKKELVEQLKYFKTHQNQLVEEHKGKFLVIKNKQVKGAYDSEIEAYIEAKKKFESGTFLIQECLTGEHCYTQTFHTPGIFT